MALCEVALSDGSDLLAEEMKFGLGWNSASTTVIVGLFCIFMLVKMRGPNKQLNNQSIHRLVGTTDIY